MRVNIHWVLKDDGTGNFRPNDDGLGHTSMNGYIMAKAMIDTANSYLASNARMWLPIPNSTPELEIGFAYVLNGVYFDKSSVFRTLSLYDFSLCNLYSKDRENTINV